MPTILTMLSTGSEDVKVRSSIKPHVIFKDSGGIQDKAPSLDPIGLSAATVLALCGILRLILTSHQWHRRLIQEPL